MSTIRMKSRAEVLARLRELVQRSKKRYMRAHLKPQGQNCIHKVWDDEKKEWFCGGCGTTEPEICLNHACFKPELTRDELSAAFREDICNTQRMLRDYRAEAALLWVLGQFDSDSTYEESKESILLEHRTVPSTLKSND